jgi:hypothetical protein
LKKPGIACTTNVLSFTTRTKSAEGANLVPSPRAEPIPIVYGFYAMRHAPCEHASLTHSALSLKQNQEFPDRQIRNIRIAVYPIHLYIVL